MTNLTRSEIQRAELQKDIDEFLAGGGKIETITTLDREVKTPPFNKGRDIKNYDKGSQKFKPVSGKSVRARVEQEYGKPFEDVVADLEKRLGSKERVADYIGCHVTYLYTIMKRIRDSTGK